jgi:hypothetical protein
MSINTRSQISGQRLIAMLTTLAVSLTVAACSGNVGSGGEIINEETAIDSGSQGDPSGWLGAATWMATGTIGNEKDGTYGALEMEVTDLKLEPLTSVYYWLGEYPTPIVQESSVWVELTERGTDTKYAGQTVNLILQATGSPEEFASGRRTDGGLAISVLMILDSNWSLLEAGGGYTSTYSEILTRYQSGQAGVQKLLDDARVTTVFDNDNTASDALADEADTALDRPATPGQLGEWRRSEGFEPPLQVNDEARQLDEWLANKADARQLPTADDEVISPDQASAIGSDGWVQWELYVLDPETMRSAFQWVGVRIADAGVIGPFSTDSENAIAITGLGPLEGKAEFLAWQSAEVALDRPDLVVGIADEWRPPDVAILQPRRDPREAKVTIMTFAEASALLTESQRGVGRSSPES